MNILKFLATPQNPFEGTKVAASVLLAIPGWGDKACGPPGRTSPVCFQFVQRTHGASRLHGLLLVTSPQPATVKHFNSRVGNRKLRMLHV